MTRPTPLPNRCRPDGAIIADAARGTMTGNRGGRLHRADFTLGRARWRSPAWICCEISFRGRQRSVMGPGYTELFFLDEATALAAGHRPCFECRRAEARHFAALWARARGADAPPRAGEIDRILHAARRAPRSEIRPDALPPGAICEQDGRFWLRTARTWLEWHPSGYVAAPHLPDRSRAALACTPGPVSAVLRAGYAPRLHPSAAT